MRPFRQTSLIATMQAMSVYFISWARYNFKSLKVRHFKVCRQQNKSLVFYNAN